MGMAILAHVNMPNITSLTLLLLLCAFAQGFLSPQYPQKFHPSPLRVTASTKLQYQNVPRESRGILHPKGPIAHVSEFFFTALNIEPPVHPDLSLEDVQCTQVNATQAVMLDESSPALSPGFKSHGTPQPNHAAADPGENCRISARGEATSPRQRVLYFTMSEATSS